MFVLDHRKIEGERQGTKDDDGKKQIKVGKEPGQKNWTEPSNK